MMMQGGGGTTGSSPALVGMIGQNPHLGASGSLHSGSSHHSVTGGRQRGGSQQQYPPISSSAVHLMGSSTEPNSTVFNIMNDGGKDTQSSFGSQQHDFLPFTGLSISSSHPPLSNSDPPFQPQPQLQYQPQNLQQPQYQQQSQHQQQQPQYHGHFQPPPSPFAAYQGGGFMPPPPGGMFHHHHMQQFMPPQMMHHHMAPPPPWQVSSNKPPSAVSPGGGGGGGGGGRNQGKIWQEQLAEAVRDKGIMCKDFYTTSRCSLQCCPYAHIKEGQTCAIPDMACNFHLQGRCLRDNCRYFHGSKEQLRTLHRRRAAGGAGGDTPPPVAGGGGKGGSAVSTYNPSEFLPIRASPAELGIDVIERVLASHGSLPPVAQIAASILLEQGQIRAAATAGRPQDYFDVPSTNRLLQSTGVAAVPTHANHQQFSYISPVSSNPEINVYSDGTGGTYQLTHHPASRSPQPPSQPTPTTFNPSSHPQYYYAMVDGTPNTVVHQQPPQQHQWAAQQQQQQQVHQPTSNIMFTPAPLSSNSHNGTSAIFSNPSTTTATSIHSQSQLAASNHQLAASGQNHTATSTSSSQNHPSHSLPVHHQVASQTLSSSNKGDMSNVAQPSSQGMGAIESESYFGFNTLLSNGSGAGGGNSAQKDSTTMIRATSDAFDDCNPAPPQGQQRRDVNHLMGSFSSSGQAVAGSDSTVHVGGGRPPQYPPNQTGNSNTSDMMFSSPPKGGTPHHQFLAPGSSMQTASSTSVSSQQRQARNSIGDPRPVVVISNNNTINTINTPQQE